MMSDNGRRLATAGVLTSALLLAGCGNQGVHEIPWIDASGHDWAASTSQDLPDCLPSDFTAPAVNQKWGGVWHDAASGFFMMKNISGRSCRLAPPLVSCVVSSLTVWDDGVCHHPHWN